MSASERRERLYDGALFVYRPTKTSMEFCEFAAHLIRQAFGDLDPETAQYALPVERYVEILQELKPKFIHHPQSKEFLRKILSERGCDPEDIYFDVPRMRSSTSDGYLTSGIAYAWHPHRDTWYSAPPTQINWWTPIFPMLAENGMMTFLEKFHQAVPNDSAKYDYVEWNKKHRFATSENIKSDSRPLPGSTVPIDKKNALTVVTEVGAFLMFSGHQLHASVENHSGKTRFSIDFRTVSLSDTTSKSGAPIEDVACTNSSIRDFIRTSDFTSFPENVAKTLDSSA